MANSPSTQGIPSNKDFQKLLASNCRRELQKDQALYDFLHQPFRFAFNGTSQPRTPVGTHLLKMVAPLMQGELEIQHHIIDRGEPLVAGMEMVLRRAVLHHDWREDLAPLFILNSLLPLYLIAGPVRDNDAINQSLCMMRELVALTVLDRSLEHDLGLWIRESENGWDPTGRRLKNHFSIDLSELAQEIWRVPETQNTKSSQGIQLDRGRLTEVRRNALWNVSRQWLANSKQITLPAELAVERIAWQTVRAHFATLFELLQAVVIRAPHLPSEGGTDTRAPFRLLENCERAVEEALIGDHASVQLNNGMHEPSVGVIGEEGLIGGEIRGAIGEIGVIGGVDSKSAEVSASVAPKKDAAKKDAAKIEFAPIDSMRVVEIRSSNDPKLVGSLDQQLGQCRVNQGSIALAVARTMQPDGSVRPAGLLPFWQQAFVDFLRENTDNNDLRGFITPQGEIAVMIDDVDRQTATAIVREALQVAVSAQRKASSLGDDSFISLISGLSIVSAPARSFKIQQLIDAAWRCMDGAAAQGAGSVKSIEVY